MKRYNLASFFASSCCLLVSLPLAAVEAGTISFAYKGDAKCDDVAYVKIDSMTCGGNAQCGPGDTVLMRGTLRLLEELEETDYLCTNTEACFNGVSSRCEWYKSGFNDVCSALVPMYDDQDGCPSEGYYYMHGYFQIPAADTLPLNSSKFL